MCCILGGSLPGWVLPFALLGKQLCWFYFLNPHPESPSGECESFICCSTTCFFFPFFFVGKYYSLCNMPRPYRAPHVRLSLLLLELFLVCQKKCQCHIVWADELLCTVRIREAGISSGWWHPAKYISVLLLHTLLKGLLRSLRQLPLCWTSAWAICELISSCCFESYVESLSFRILSEYFRPFPLHSSSP